MNTTEKSIELQEWFTSNSEWQKRNESGDYYSMTKAFRNGWDMRNHINALDISMTDENKLLSSLIKKVKAEMKAEIISDKFMEGLRKAEDKAYKIHQKR